jgi:hypothetical protein
VLQIVAYKKYYYNYYKTKLKNIRTEVRLYRLLKMRKSCIFDISYRNHQIITLTTVNKVNNNIEVFECLKVFVLDG